MSEKTPRIPPLDMEDWGDAQKEVVMSFIAGLSKDLQDSKEGKNNDLAGLGLLLNYPELAKVYLPYSSWMLRENALSVRDRELLILRIASTRKCKYEWAQHVMIALDFGFNDEEIIRVKQGSEAPGWTNLEQHLIKSADELLERANITDATWEVLSQHYDQRQLLELIYTVGTYDMVAMSLNSTGIPLSVELKEVLQKHPVD